MEAKMAAMEGALMTAGGVRGRGGEAAGGD